MPKINVLDKHTAELIAAGEVVERPASVIKELVENSIDSGAGIITVEIKNGGITFIRVSDDGCGIEKDDIKNAFLRHATSKIKNEQDLNSILTLGFRGEALASVSSVAKTELITRTKNSELGYRYVICGGEETEFEQCGAPFGTTLIVRDLFYNTPARRKFLKKDTTESNVVIAMLERIAIANPAISFKLIKDGKTVMNTPGDSNRLNAVYAVLGKEFAETLIPVDYELEGIKVCGFACIPQTARKNRNSQYFYINSRYVRSKTAVAALEQAYKNLVMVGKYPACVLNIIIDPSLVDVNVHPSKAEVRFSDEGKIFSAVYYAVKSALMNTAQQEIETMQAPKNDTAVLLEPKKPVFEQMSVEDYKNEFSGKTSNHADDFFEKKPEKSFVDYELPHYNPEYRAIPAHDVKPLKPKYDIDEKIEPPKKQITFKYIGELFDNYIIVQTGETAVLIDKHAAHERIIFNELSANANLEPQMLLVAQKVRLPSADYEVITANLEGINKLGFEIEDFGLGTVLVRGVPMCLDGNDAEELICEMAGKLSDKFTDFSPEFLDWLFHSVACRAAIKAGNKTSALELSELAQKVLNDENVRYCPHGRPVCVQMSLNEIKKKFFRI